MKKPSIFIAVLNMGLGHATRSLPLIHYLLNKDWQVVIGSSGRSQIFLKKEVPAASFIDLPDYQLRYATKGVSLAGLLPQIPGLLQAISREHQITEQIVKNQQLQAVISDHRYGCYSRVVPSFLISHQLRFAAPCYLRPFEKCGFWFNRHFHKKFQAVIVPDILQKQEGLISGRLSHSKGEAEYHYCGILSSLGKDDKVSDLDLLVSISGPEPQRTVLEQKIRQQIKDIPGEKVVVLGKPEVEKMEKDIAGLTFFSHLSRQEMQEYFNRSRLIVTRSGFSTVMELLELGKNALLIPTPGQTEQQLLAKRLKNRHWFYSVTQDTLDLARDITIARSYAGAPNVPGTEETLPKIFQILSNGLGN